MNLSRSGILNNWTVHKRISRVANDALSYQVSFLTWRRLATFVVAPLGLLTFMAALIAQSLGIGGQGGSNFAEMAIASYGLGGFIAGLGIALPASRTRLVKLSPRFMAALDRPLRPVWILLHVAVLSGVFVFYVTTFVFHPHQLQESWLFGADNMKRVYFGAFDGWGAYRHLLFVFTAVPLFKVVRSVQIVIGEGQVLLNVAFVIPLALAGAVNLYVAFRIFLINHEDKVSALLFTLLYGVAASTWIFSSFPETHLVTTLASNIFLVILISQPNVMSSLPALATMNAVAAYAAPQQVLLALVPGFSYIIQNRWSLRSFGPVIKYGLIVGVLFLIPYLTVLKQPDNEVLYFVRGWADVGNFFEPEWYILVFLNFLPFAVIGPVVHPNIYSDHSLAVLGQLSVPWMILTSIFAIFAARCLWGLRSSHAKAKRLVPGLALFAIAYILVFLYVDPRESFIFAVMSLLPWLLILHTGYVGISSRLWRIVLACLIIGIFINNLMLMDFINELIEAHPGDWIILESRI